MSKLDLYPNLKKAQAAREAKRKREEELQPKKEEKEPEKKEQDQHQTDAYMNEMVDYVADLRAKLEEQERRLMLIEQYSERVLEKEEQTEETEHVSKKQKTAKDETTESEPQQSVLRFLPDGDSVVKTATGILSHLLLPILLVGLKSYRESHSIPQNPRNCQTPIPQNESNIQNHIPATNPNTTDSYGYLRG